MTAFKYSRTHLGLGNFAWFSKLPKTRKAHYALNYSRISLNILFLNRGV